MAAKKYRKRPIIVTAEQFTDESSLPQGVFENPNGTYWVHTLEGSMWVLLRDWIITGIKGELYSCKPDTFAVTYKEVTDTPPNPWYYAAKVIEEAEKKGYERAMKEVQVKGETG